MAKWSPPPANSYKISIDGATLNNHKEVSLGVLIQDRNWCVITTTSKRAKNAQAVEFAANFVKQIGLHRRWFWRVCVKK